jgi:hypothetical protein
VVTSTWQMIVADSCDSVAISFEKLTSALYQPLSLRFACTVRMGVSRARSFGDSRFGAFTEELVEYSVVEWYCRDARWPMVPRLPRPSAPLPCRLYAPEIL